MNSMFRYLACLAFALLAGAPALAAEGDFDDSFGTDATAPGFGFYPSEYPASNLDAGRIVVPTHDGKLYMIGRLNVNQGRLAVQRTDANGYPDYTFGNAGMRTYVRPCGFGEPGDAKVDSQNRLWLVFQGCDAFTVYRFTTNGDLDASLQGSGTVTLSFDRGQHSDSSNDLLLLPDGGFIVAGVSAGDTHKDLALAAFDASGAPSAAFGSGGKVVVAMPHDVYRISGLHRMNDGRLVIDGILLQDTYNETFVVRLQSSGLPDAAFGISAPGISRYDFRPVDRLNALISPVRSWLESDGKLVQAGTGGYTAFPNSRYDVVITRWRADGSLDTSVGTAGTRRYPLDLSGNTPADSDDNKELTAAMVREGNGRWLITYYAFKPGPGKCFGVLRLKRDFSPDSTFGNAGHLCSNLTVSGTEYNFDAYDLITQPGRVVLGGSAHVAVNGNMLSMVAVKDDLLFGDTFE